MVATESRNRQVGRHRGGIRQVGRHRGNDTR